MANKHINKKNIQTIDPLLLTSMRIGKELSKVNGVNWKINAKEYYQYTILAQKIIANVIKENKQRWSEMSVEEKAEVSQECIQILMDRSKAQQAMAKLGMN